MNSTNNFSVKVLLPRDIIMYIESTFLGLNECVRLQQVERFWRKNIDIVLKSVKLQTYKHGKPIHEMGKNMAANV